MISKEPSVLLKKKRGDPADGTRIEIAKGATISIAIADNEIFRVTQGGENRRKRHLDEFRRAIAKRGR